MKRSTQTLARTINLSQTKSCEKSSTVVKKLVNADVAQSCPTIETFYKPISPVTVRICSRKELERTCPPKLCDCPIKGAPISKPSIIGVWAKLLSKAAIAGGLVFWTSENGVWGDSTETEDLYYRIVETIAPALPELPDLNELKLPHLDSMKHTTYEAYNHFVCSLISGLAEIPAAIKKKITAAIFGETDDSKSGCTETNEKSGGNETTNA